MDAHSGTISVHSTPQVGSVFTVMVKCYERPNLLKPLEVDLPLSSQLTEDVTKQSRGNLEKFVFHREACLIVDDSPLNRKLLHKHLRSHFTVIDFAENGVEAIEAIKKRTKEEGLNYDLVCLDSVMPVS